MHPASLIKNHCAIILCGGRGSRLGSVSESLPKSLIMVHDKPLLWYTVLMLYKNKHKSIPNLTPGSSIIDLSIAKQRNGPVGNTQLLFNEYLTKFEDYDKNAKYNPTRSG